MREKGTQPRVGGLLGDGAHARAFGNGFDIVPCTINTTLDFGDVNLAVLCCAALRCTTRIIISSMLESGLSFVFLCPRPGHGGTRIWVFPFFSLLEKVPFFSRGVLVWVCGHGG